MNMDKEQMRAMMRNPMLRNVMGDNVEDIEKLLEDE